MLKAIVTDSKALWAAAQALGDEDAALVILIARPAEEEDAVDFEVRKNVDDEAALMIVRTVYEHMRQQRHARLQGN